MSDPKVDRIASAAEAALLEARAASSNTMGAVNWADLRVIDVVKCQGREGNAWYRVEIEEAAPGCGLERFVFDKLFAQFPNEVIAVKAEW